MQSSNVNKKFSENMGKIEKEDGGQRCIKTRIDAVCEKNKDK